MVVAQRGVICCPKSVRSGMESSRVVKELLSRHSQLEQSETKAQLVFVTALSLTQVTELKLLLDIGHRDDRFYAMILAMLVASICLEVFVGVIVIYMGNLHYYQTSADGTTKEGVLTRMFGCISRRHSHRHRRHRKNPAIFSPSPTAASQSCHSFGLRGVDDDPHFQRPDIDVRRSTADTTFFDRGPAMTTEQPSSSDRPYRSGDGGGGGGGGVPDLRPVFDRELSADVARLAVAAASEYVESVDAATRRCPTSGDLRGELARAQRELSRALREQARVEADRRLYEAQLDRALRLRDIGEDEHERKTFRRLSFWQRLVTYLLYLVLLLNIFITTFGITSGSTVIHSNNESSDVMIPTATSNTSSPSLTSSSSSSSSSTITTTFFSASSNFSNSPLSFVSLNEPTS